MSGELIYLAPERHRCEPPSTTAVDGNIEIASGSIWRCECGQHWQAYGLWVRISPRAAQRELKRVSRRRSRRS